MSVTGLIFRAAGSPADEAWAGDVPGTCRLCGSGGAGREFAAWVRPTFTDHDLLHPGDIVCTACLFCAQERTGRWLADRLGKEKGQRFRNYSHVVLGGKWHCLTKGEKRRIAELLLREPEVAVIADSGQRHLVYRARSGWWQFELAPPIRPDTGTFARLLDASTALYSAGAPKSEIESGRWTLPTVRRVGLDMLREHNPVLDRHRGSPMLRLVVFLTQKETVDDVATEPNDGEQYAFA